MALKFKYAKREDVPANVAAFYVEREGGFVLDAEGVVEKEKLEEFRATNIAVLKERDELKQRFAGIDPEEVRQLATEKARLEEEQRLKDGKFQEVMDARLKTARAEWEKQHQPVVAERDALHARLTETEIDRAVVTEATKRGLKPTAIPDITARARMTFKLVDGVPQAFEADGQTARPGQDGVAPMTLAEWVAALGSDAPHLFEANAGGGAAGSGSGGAGNRSGSNPFRKESWNLTEQMKLRRTDPGLAARLEATR